MDQLRSTHSNKESAAGAEKAKWQDTRDDLERRLADAQNLNESIQNELEQLRNDNATTERDLRVQLEEAQQAQPKGYGDDSELQRRYELLQQELYEQEQISEEVRTEAKQYLAEMRALSEQSSEAMEHESRLISQVDSLESEIKDWKTRYARARTQLRSLRTSSIGLSQPVDAGALARDAALTSPDGLVKDVHLTRFQLAIDELLQTGRGPDARRVIDAMKAVIMSTRTITVDCDAGTSTATTSAGMARSPTSGTLLTSPDVPGHGEPTRNPAKLKQRVSATANNLITAAKNHAGAEGLSPVSLLDAAASHLTMAVVELVKVCRVRLTPAEELAEDFVGQDQKILPETPNSFGEAGGFSPVKGAGGSPRRMMVGNNSNRGSDESADYSATSTSSPGRRGSGWNRSTASSMRSRGDPGLEDLKVCDPVLTYFSRSTIYEAVGGGAATCQKQDHEADT